MRGEKQKINKTRKYYWFYYRIKVGLISIRNSKNGIRLLLGYFIFVLISWFSKYSIWEVGNEYPYERILLKFNLISLYVICLVTILLLYGQVLKDYALHKAFIRSGIVNSVGESPIMNRVLSIKTSFIIDI